MSNEARRPSILQAIAMTGDQGLAEHVEDYGRQDVNAPNWPPPIEQRIQDDADIIAMKAKAAEQRQRDEDAALADADEIVRRMRQRNGRKVCSLADGRTIREIWERLKAMSGPEVTADDEPAWRA